MLHPVAVCALIHQNTSPKLIPLKPSPCIHTVRWQSDQFTSALHPVLNLLLITTFVSASLLSSTLCPVLRHLSMHGLRVHVAGHKDRVAAARGALCWPDGVSQLQLSLYLNPTQPDPLLLPQPRQACYCSLPLHALCTSQPYHFRTAEDKDPSSSICQNLIINAHTTFNSVIFIMLSNNCSTELFTASLFDILYNYSSSPFRFLFHYIQCVH